MPEYFEIAAEFLHLYVGRRCAVDVGGGKIPFGISAVRYQPESGLILVAVATPVFQLGELAFTPDAYVAVEQAAA